MGYDTLTWIYRIEQKRLLAYEKRIACTFSHALLSTAIEKHDLQRLIPDAPVSLVGNGVDLDYFQSTGCPRRPASIAFTGVMNYFPTSMPSYGFAARSFRWFKGRCQKRIFDDLRKPARRCCAASGETARRNRNRPSSGHPTLCRSSGGICCAPANGSQASRTSYSRR